VKVTTSRQLIITGDTRLENFFQPTHLESLPELVRHDVVEHRVDGRGQEVENPGGVHQDQVDGDGVILRFLGGVGQVHRQQSLGVERRPADKERRHHRDCNNNLRLIVDPVIGQTGTNKGQ
jgi:hypothetical protein